MEWRDEGVILSMRPHGESAAIIEVFTRAHGRHAGVVRGGASRRMSAHLQPGTQVAVDWQARLAEHIGVFKLEPLRSRAHVLGNRLALAGLSAVCALLATTLPERDPHDRLWQATVALLDALGADDWAPGWPSRWMAAYLRWEMLLLEDLGFGLDLASCAVTGTTEALAYVSPKTGRAVSLQGAGDWADRLLPLPAGMAGGGAMGLADVHQGLRITGHFLGRELVGARQAGQQAGQQAEPLPEARGRLVEVLARGLDTL